MLKVTSTGINLNDYAIADRVWYTIIRALNFLHFIGAYGASKLRSECGITKQPVSASRVPTIKAAFTVSVDQLVLYCNY
jgi:hypothetical protein